MKKNICYGSIVDRAQTQNEAILKCKNDFRCACIHKVVCSSLLLRSGRCVPWMVTKRDNNKRRYNVQYPTSGTSNINNTATRVFRDRITLSGKYNRGGRNYTWQVNLPSDSKIEIEYEISSMKYLELSDTAAGGKIYYW